MSGRWAGRAAAAALLSSAAANASPPASPAAASSQDPAAAGVGWDQAFSTAGAREGLTLAAVVLDRAGREHRVRLFRDGEAQLRRDTDETGILVHRSPGDELYRVIRRAQGVGYRLHARNLFRIGADLDWGSLATLLLRPRVPGRVVALARAEEITPFGPCRWKEAVDQGLRVCWSERLRVPLSVEEKRTAGWTKSLRIEGLRAGPVPASVFAVPADLREIDLDAQAAPEAD
ncbi:MAG: hypothetical protein NVS4B10_01900 [Myxococcales bacterium]